MYFTPIGEKQRPTMASLFNIELIKEPKGRMTHSTKTLFGKTAIHCDLDYQVPWFPRQKIFIRKLM